MKIGSTSHFFLMIKKKLFKNVTLQILNFILMFNNKIFLIWCNVNFVSTGFHCIKQYKKKKQRKFKIWRVTFLFRISLINSMDCAKFFQFNSFQPGNIIEVGQTVFCWLKPAALALWLSEAQVHRSHVLSLAALWHHSLLMNGIVIYMYYLLEKKLKHVSGDRMEGQTVTTVMILSFRTDRSGQTVQTQIRLLISV